jgi:hypothetical protein
MGAILLLIEQGGEPPEQTIDTGKVQPVVPARRLDHRLVRSIAAPVLKVSPPAAKDDELPLVPALANRDAHRIGLRNLAAIFPQRRGPRRGRVPPSESTDYEPGLLPCGRMTGNQRGHLIEVHPAFHTARIPDPRTWLTAIRPEPTRA